METATKWLQKNLEKSPLESQGLEDYNMDIMRCSFSLEHIDIIVGKMTSHDVSGRRVMSIGDFLHFFLTDFNDITR